MTDDPSTGFRVELQAALDVLQPQLNGLASISNDTLSDGAHDAITKLMDSRTRRKGLINDVIHAMNVVLEKIRLLQGDGYPELPPVEVDPPILAEIQNNLNNAVIAAGLFGATTTTDQAAITGIHAGLKATQADRAALMQP